MSVKCDPGYTRASGVCVLDIKPQAPKKTKGKKKKPSRAQKAKSRMGGLTPNRALELKLGNSKPGLKALKIIQFFRMTLKDIDIKKVDGVREENSKKYLEFKPLRQHQDRKPIVLKRK